MQQRIISAEDQMQRVLRVKQRMEDIQLTEFDLLKRRPNRNQWSIIEIVGHLNAAYKLYRERIDQHLTDLPPGQEIQHHFKVGRRNAWFINMITPKEGKRLYKMKTTKKFQPIFDGESLDENAVQEIFTQFYSDKAHLMQAIKSSQSKQVRSGKINSAFGPVVRFFLPEAFEFIIGHEERHLVQIDELRELIK